MPKRRPEEEAGTRRRVRQAWELLDRVHARRRRVVGAIAALAILAPLLLGAALLGGEARLSAYDDDWDDVAAYRGAVQGLGYETRNTLISPLALRGVESPTETLVVLAGVERALTESEADALEAYVRRGGRLLLADDAGYGNALSSRFGVQFERTPLLDAGLDNERGFVRANATLDGDSYDLVLNGPSSLSNASRSAGVVLAESGEESYQDNDRNGRVDLSDAPGPFPLIVRVTAGDGVAVFMADPSLLINEMASAGDNGEFARDLTLHLLPDGGAVIFDESRHARGAASGALAPAGAALTAAASPLTAGALAILVAGGTVIAARRLSGTPQWRHQYRPAHGDPDAAGDAVERARRLAVEAAAARLDADPERVEAMSEAALARSVGDPVLAGFIAAPNKDISTRELSDILGRLRRF